MFATGRAPNIAKLGLEEAGVEIAEERRHRRRRIFAHRACPRSTPSATSPIASISRRSPIREGAAFRRHACSAASRPTVDHSNVPTAVFSDPEVGAVGLTEAEARARFARTDIYRAMFRPLKATLSGPRHDGADQARGRRHDRPRCRLPYRRRGRRRNDPDGRHRGENGRHQGRFRRHHGAASDHGRGTGDACGQKAPATPAKPRNRRHFSALSRPGAVVYISPSFRPDASCETVSRRAMIRSDAPTDDVR